MFATRSQSGFWKVLAVSLTVAAVNVAKPMHVDDTLYVNIARQIVHEPLNPYGSDLNWLNTTQPTYKVSISPPLVSYYFATVIALFGESPIILHAAMAPWLVLLAWSSFRIAARFTDFPATVAILILVSPAVIVGTNLMLDVPMTAALCAAIEMSLCFADSGGGRHLLAANLFACIAVLAKYPAIVFLPISCAIGWQSRKYRPLLCGIAPILALGIWQAWSAALYHDAQIDQGLSFLRAGRFDRAAMLSERIVTSLAILGSTFPIFLASLKRKGVSLSAFTAGALFAYVLLRRYPADLPLMFVIAAGLGGMIVLPLLMQLRNRDDWVLLVWVLSLFVFVNLFAPFVAVRSFLPALLPLTLLNFRAVERIGGSALLRNLTMTATILLGALLCWCDVRWANIYPTAVDEIQKDFPEAAPRTVFVGHWGWQYYCERAGFRPFEYGPLQFPVGTLFVLPLHADAIPFVEPTGANRPCVLVKTIELPRHPLGITVWNRYERIRFYGNNFGELPWGFSKSPTEVIKVYEWVDRSR